MQNKYGGSFDISNPAAKVRLDPEKKQNLFLISRLNVIRPADNMKTFENVNNLLYPLLSIALIFIILIGMKTTAYLINILLISLILTLLGIPILKRLNRAGLSDALSVAIIIGLYIVCIVVFIFLVYESVYVFISRLPLYESLLSERLSELIGLLGGFGITGDMIGSFLKPDWNEISNILLGVVTGGSMLAMNLFFILVITCFALLEVRKMPARLVRVYGDDSGKIENVRKIISNIIKWLVVKTKTNVVLGVSFGGLLYALGIDMAIFWALMAIILSYVPYVGLIIVAVPAIFLAWLQLGLWGAAVVIIGICIINAVVENFVFSKFAADSFRIPPLIVIVTLILWSWILGPVGLFLSVPFTVIIIALIQGNEDTRWIADLLGFDDPGVEGEE